MIAYLFLLLFSAASSSHPAMSSNARLLEIMQSLHAMTPQRMTDGELERRLVGIVNHVEEREDIARLALLSRTMTTGLAEDEAVDRVYWRMFWVCARRLGERSDDEAILLLDRVAERGGLGGGERMLMDELQAKQRKRVPRN